MLYIFRNIKERRKLQRKLCNLYLRNVRNGAKSEQLSDKYEEILKRLLNTYCIPESFNTIISNQLLSFVLKKQFETFVLKISGIQK